MSDIHNKTEPKMHNPDEAIRLIVRITDPENMVCHHCHARASDGRVETERTPEYVTLKCGQCGSRGRISFKVVYSYTPLDNLELLKNNHLSELKNHVVCHYPNGECPDCFEKIPEDSNRGDSCANCGHVFW